MQMRPSTLLFLGGVLSIFGLWMAYYGDQNNVLRTVVIGVIVVLVGVGTLTGGFFMLTAERKARGPRAEKPKKSKKAEKVAPSPQPVAPVPQAQEAPPVQLVSSTEEPAPPPPETPSPEPQPMLSQIPLSTQAHSTNEGLARAWSDVEELRSRARLELDTAAEARQAASRLQSHTQRMLEHSDLLRQEVTQARSEAHRTLQEAMRMAQEAKSHRDEMLVRLEEARRVETEAQAMMAQVTETLRQSQAIREEAQQTRQDALRIINEAEAVRQDALRLVTSRQQSRQPQRKAPTPKAKGAPRQRKAQPKKAEPEPPIPEVISTEDDTQEVEAATSRHPDIPSLDKADQLMSPLEVDKLSSDLERLLSSIESTGAMPQTPPPIPEETSAPSYPQPTLEPAEAPPAPETQAEPLAPGELLPDLNLLFQGQETVEEAPPPGPAPTTGGETAPEHQTYSGSMRLIIVPNPDAEALQRVWNAVEGLLGVGYVLGSGPTSDGQGLEMVLDLSQTSLTPQQLLEALPGARVTETGTEELTLSLSTNP